MSYGVRVASFEQFCEILKESERSGFDFAPKASQIGGLMEGVTVLLSIEEMSADYLKDIATGKPYNPHHRVKATILFDYGSYMVDVLDETLFKLPTVAQWQETLPVITLPAEMIEEVMADDGAGEPNSRLQASARLMKELIHSGVPQEPEGGWDAVAEIRADRDAENEPEYLDNKDEDEDGGASVTAPVPDPEPAPTTSAAKTPPKRNSRRQPKSLGAGSGPADLPAKEPGDTVVESVPSEAAVE